MAPKTQKLNQKEAAAKTQQSKCNEYNYLLVPKYISDIVKEVLDDNQDYQDSFEQEKTHSLTTSEAITSPRTRRTSSLVPKATTPIRAGRIAFLVPDVVTSP
ncbi:hypothetical protein GLOIN_2v1480316 [Rhizophagus irregularis DAOM 181602=DAOM 197198]|nr:hypothetical protein GLOIN_2v1480316 [Rhizophagus irregularis DAOM 181602=DAOM 197198]